MQKNQFSTVITEGLTQEVPAPCEFPTRVMSAAKPGKVSMRLVIVGCVEADLPLLTLFCAFTWVMTLRLQIYGVTGVVRIISIPAR
jgi:hypothetical protein